MKVNVSNQVYVPLTIAQANALLDVIDKVPALHDVCDLIDGAVYDGLDGTIDGVVQSCMAQTSRADRRVLESDDGARYALEWIEWAQRTGFDCLQGYTKPQLQHIADRLHEQF